MPAFQKDLRTGPWTLGGLRSATLFVLAVTHRTSRGARHRQQVYFALKFRQERGSRVDPSSAGSHVHTAPAGPPAAAPATHAGGVGGAGSLESGKCSDTTNSSQPLPPGAREVTPVVGTTFRGCQHLSQRKLGRNTQVETDAVSRQFLSVTRTLSTQNVRTCVIIEKGFVNWASAYSALLVRASVPVR